MPSFAQLLTSSSLASSLSSGIPQALSDYAAALTAAGVVPDAVPTFDGEPLGISLAGTPYPFDLGQGYTVAQTQVLPQYSLDPVFAATYAASNQSFVMVYIDPDALSPQNRTVANARHYIGPNYVVDSTGALTNTTIALSDFFGPAPPAGTFNHRYTHLLYLQPPNFVQNALEYLNGTALELAPNAEELGLAAFLPFLEFNLTDFTAATGLADPVAMNFFMTAPDSVPVHSVAGQQGALAAAGISPGVVPPFNPLAILDLSYSNVNGRDFLVRTGENFTDTNAAQPPQFLLSFNTTVSPSLAGQTFTVMMMDLDSQGPQNLHMIQQDMTIGSSLNSLAPLVSTSAPLVPYAAPSTPSGPAHRIAFFVFVQPAGFTKAATPLIPASPFNVASFRKATGLGLPIAGTYFYAGENLFLQ